MTVSVTRSYDDGSETTDLDFDGADVNDVVDYADADDGDASRYLCYLS